MNARVGDRITVESRHVGGGRRVGELLEVRPPHVRVRWSDGRETVLVPGPDAKFERVQREAPVPEARMTRVDIRVEENADTCEATATLHATTATFAGVGRARRNPSDPMVPMIGEELAIARALDDLAHKLSLAAQNAITSHESRPLHAIP